MNRILLADGEPSVTEPLAYLLRQSGFEVIVACTGGAAVAQLAQGGAALVLLDLELPGPGPGGVDLCRELRSRSGVPVIVLTALDGEDQKVAALEAGADDYMTTPFSGRELIARIGAVLRRYDAHQQGSEGAVLTAGPLRIDAARHVVSLAGVEIVLRLKEFTALELLVRSRGHVVTRGQLIERIWGDRFDGDPKRADAIINRLRGKLETDPTDPHHLLTVRGLGYRFEP